MTKKIDPDLQKYMTDVLVSASSIMHEDETLEARIEINDDQAALMRAELDSVVAQNTDESSLTLFKGLLYAEIEVKKAARFIVYSGVLWGRSHG